ncbi:MAG TPA: TOBE domain-containing protein, partial [Reyranella sp.]|nr:TOBE domain-containing protein [Reyranella sp.]
MPAGATVGSTLTIGFRPESVVVSDRPPQVWGPYLEGKIVAASFAGDAIEYRIDLGGRTIGAKGQPFEFFEEGRHVFMHVPPERCYVLESLAAPE